MLLLNRGAGWMPTANSSAAVGRTIAAILPSFALAQPPDSYQTGSVVLWFAEHGRDPLLRCDQFRRWFPVSRYVRPCQVGPRWCRWRWQSGWLLKQAARPHKIAG